MDKFDRIYSFHKILRQARRPVPRKVIQEKLECSRATFERLVLVLRDKIGAPLDFDRTARGWHYDTKAGEHPYELPGLWFNASELHALLATQKLLENVQPGLLDEHLAPLRERIEQLLSAQTGKAADVTSRVRILGMTARRSGEHFQAIAGALMQRQKIHITYHARGRDEISERAVSPQRLTHYRDNWYLDAWCHLRDDLRSFAVERVQECHSIQDSALEIDAVRLDAHFAGAYGIFAGPAGQTAVLRFSPERARWVAEEQWHPKQEGKLLKDGHYELRIPYGDPRELIMDILKHGPEVEVIGPEELRNQIKACLKRAVESYESCHSRESGNPEMQGLPETGGGNL